MESAQNRMQAGIRATAARFKKTWTLARVSALGLVIAVILTVSAAKAFMTSEDQQFQADIDEAKKRANDFKHTMQRIENDQKEIEAAGVSQSRLRERDAAETEQVRRDYVRERNNRPSAELALERLEREDDIQKKKAADEMDANRREYVQKRDRVRRVLERDAYIDEKLEYGL